MKAKSTPRRLAALLPDIPRWIETRSTLLSGNCDVLGLGDGATGSYVVRDRGTPLVVAVGRASDQAVREAVKGQLRGVLVCQPEDKEYISELLDGWRVDLTTIFLLADQSRLTHVPAGAARLVTGDEIETIEYIPSEFRDELIVAAGRSEVAATVVDEILTSFCYCAAVTGTLWDISIHTLEPYRRRGHAGLCVSYMIRRELDQQKQPVWGAEQSNVASMRLARKLGFEPVDQMVVFHPPTT